MIRELINAAENLENYYNRCGGGRTDWIRMGHGPVSAADLLIPLPQLSAEELAAEEAERECVRAERARDAYRRGLPRVRAYVERQVAAGQFHH